MGAPTTSLSPSTAFPFFRLLVLSGAIFVSVSSEFLPTGLLPDMARDLQVSESKIGLLVTVFALTVVVSTAPLTSITRRFSRKWLMVVLLSTFALSNVFAALAPTYELLVAARILGGLAHGLFWAVTGPYASHLVPKRQLARAIAVTNAGGTAAFIAGVPVATALGHALGWRLAFVAMAGLVLVFMLLVVFFLPPVSHLEQLATGEIPLPLRQDKTIPGIIIVCITVVLVVLGHNVLYTYIAPWLISIAAFPADAVPGLLVLYGAAGAVGLVLAGLLGDRYPRASFAGFIAAVGLSVVLLAVSSNVQWLVIVAIALWSASFGGIPSLLHARMLHTASRRLRDIGAAWITTSFNVAIGGGALLGGLLLDRVGLFVLPWSLVALIAVALTFVLVSDSRRARLARIV